MATTKEELLEGLNEGLAAEFQEVIAYRLVASLCSAAPADAGCSRMAEVFSCRYTKVCTIPRRAFHASPP